MTGPGRIGPTEQDFMCLFYQVFAETPFAYTRMLDTPYGEFLVNIHSIIRDWQKNPNGRTVSDLALAILDMGPKRTKDLVEKAERSFQEIDAVLEGCSGDLIAEKLHLLAERAKNLIVENPKGKGSSDFRQMFEVARRVVETTSRQLSSEKAKVKEETIKQEFEARVAKEKAREIDLADREKAFQDLLKSCHELERLVVYKEADRRYNELVTLLSRHQRELMANRFEGFVRDAFGVTIFSEDRVNYDPKVLHEAVRNLNRAILMVHPDKFSEVSDADPYKQQSLKIYRFLVDLKNVLSLLERLSRA